MPPVPPVTMAAVRRKAPASPVRAGDGVEVPSRGENTAPAESTLPYGSASEEPAFEKEMDVDDEREAAGWNAETSTCPPEAAFLSWDRFLSMLMLEKTRETGVGTELLPMTCCGKSAPTEWKFTSLFET